MFLKPIPPTPFEARLSEALARARMKGGLTADEVDALLGAPGFDGTRFADFSDTARAEGLELAGLDDGPIGEEPPDLKLVKPGVDVSISDDPENQILNR